MKSESIFFLFYGTFHRQIGVSKNFPSLGAKEIDAGDKYYVFHLFSIGISLEVNKHMQTLVKRGANLRSGSQGIADSENQIVVNFFGCIHRLDSEDHFE